VEAPLGLEDTEVGCSFTKNTEKRISAIMARANREEVLLLAMCKEPFSLLRLISKGDERCMIFKAAKVLRK
jgi:hypothetical protein